MKSRWKWTLLNGDSLQAHTVEWRLAEGGHCWMETCWRRTLLSGDSLKVDTAEWRLAKGNTAEWRLTESGHCWTETRWIWTLLSGDSLKVDTAEWRLAESGHRLMQTMSLHSPTSTFSESPCNGFDFQSVYIHLCPINGNVLSKD